MEEEQSESSLYDLGFLHEEFELAIGSVSLVHPPVFLDGYGRELWAARSLEHPAWYLDDLANLFLIANTVIQLYTGRLAHLGCLTLSQLDECLTVDVGHVDPVGAEELLQQVDDERDRAPLADVGTLEGGELGGLIQHFALPDDELMQGENIHELIIGSSCSSLSSIIL